MTAAEPTPHAALRIRTLASLAVVANLAVTLPLAWILNVWQDEAYTLHSTAHGIGYAVAEALHFEQNAPLYFAFLAAWRYLDGSVFFLRLPSVLFIAATVWLTPQLARRYLPKVDPSFVAFAVALNPFAVWAGAEMRVYALTVLISALLLLAFYDGFLAPRTSKAAIVAYAACVAIALYTQYYLAFLIAAQGVTLLVYRRRSVLWYGGACAVAAVAFVPMLAILPSQVKGFKSPFVAPSLPSSFLTLAKILVHYALPLQFPHANAIYALFALSVAALAIALRKRLTAGGDGTIVLIAAFAYAFFALGTYAGGVHVLYRHGASLFVPCALSVFAATTFVQPPLRRSASAAWLCVSIAASLTSLLFTYAPLAKPGDWVRVTNYIEAHETVGEPIVVFEAENALPLSFYYRGPNRIVPIPQGVDFRAYDVSKFVIRDDAQLESTIPQGTPIWLVTAGECRSDNVRFGCNTLEGFVRSRYTVVSDVPFYGSRVRLLRPRR